MESTSRGEAESGGREEGKTREFWVGSARAFGGAMVFTLPVLMTMEMWWLGFYMQRYRLLLLMLLMFPILVFLSRTLGFKETLTWGDDSADALVAYGIGLAASFAVLLLFGIVTFAMPLHAIVGKVSVQAVPASFGAMLARSQLGGGKGNEEEGDGRDLGYAGEVLFMVVGGIFLAFNLAPTQEIILIAFKMTPEMAMLLALASLVIMHGFVYALNFKGQVSAPEGVPLWNLFLRFTVVGYAISLLVSAYMLWTFGRYEGTSMAAFVEEAIVLGFPVSIGAAGARLMLGPS